MKIVKKVIALLLVLVMVIPIATLAEEANDEPGTENTPVEEGAEEVEPSIYEEIFGEITEDSPLYPFKELMEGITLAIEVDEDGFYTLIISFINPELFESEVLTPEILDELTEILNEKLTKYLLHPEEGTEEGSEEGTEEGSEEGTEEGSEEGTEEGSEEGAEEGSEEGTEEETEEVPVIMTIEILLGLELSEEQIAGVLEIAGKEIGKLFVTEAFDAVKDAFFQAKVDLINAMNAYKEARKSGTPEEIQAAYEAMLEARENKELMEALKDAAEEMKEGIKDILELGEEEGEGKGGPKEENPSIMNKLESNGIGKGLVKAKKTNGKKPK